MTNSTADAKQRFSNRVDAYVAARPKYPPQVLEHLRSAIGFDHTWTIADIGSGTGISSELFLRNGNRVIAIEPNGPMRAAAEKSLAAFASYQSFDASAEATTLPDHSIDLIVAAQAFHWFDAGAARCEFARILRQPSPRGWVLLMWNNRKLDGSPFLRGYENLLLTYGTDYHKVRHNNINDQTFTRFFAPAPHQSARFPNHQHLDLPGLRARLLSSSYTPDPSGPRYRPMLAALDDLFARHNHESRVTLEYETELFFGQLS